MTSPGSASPTATIFQQDNQLLVHRGDDLSHACLVCAQATVGGPIVRRLSAARWITRKAMGPAVASTMFWYDLIVFIFSTVWFIVDFPARRKRIVKIGFCDSHRAKYFTFRWGGVLAAIVGTALIIASIFAQHLPDSLQPIVFIIGGLLIVLAIYLRVSAPNLQLTRETKDGMWLKGAGKPFLKLYPPLPAPPANPPHK
jgi:hypothetical protein